MKLFLLYLDAGSGSYLIQIIIGAVLAGTIYFKTIWMKIKSMFSKHKPEEDDADDDTDDVTNPVTKTDISNQHQ